ncbi:Hsp70 family protein [Kitasatospora sp. NPDC056184]|uniref:Hsp70 family protein n=1 Tax=Kitasatospora sp. NPDC056184 TaxID=3345738 RepID=UPI0035DC45E8
MSEETFQSVGFDLGHGETAVAIARTVTGAEPHLADLPGTSDRVHPTAVARCVGPAGRPDAVVLGGACFGLLRERLSRHSPSGGAVEGDELEELYLAFKEQGLGPRARRATALFVGEIVRGLTGADHGDGPGKVPQVLPETPSHWVFGVPSGWSPEVCAEYGKLLHGIITEHCPRHTVELIPESRAALLYARESQDLPEQGRRAMRSAAGSSGVLVVDMGSLTTDYTLVSGLREHPVADWNSPLGAALIEQQILRRTVARHPDRAQLEAALSEGDPRRTQVEFACRRSKEIFFGLSEDDLALNPRPRAMMAAEVEAGEGEIIDLTIRLSPAIMDEVLDAELAALKGSSWRDAFRQEMEAVRERVLDRLDELPDVVLLTGGASRMPFAQQIVRAVFDAGEPEGSQVLLGSQPEFSIAKGLAIAGRTRYRTAAFLADVDAFARETVPALIAENLDALGAEVGRVAFEGIVDEQVCPAVLRWRRNELRLLTDIGTEVGTRRTDYLGSPIGQQKLREVTHAWYRQLTGVIDQQAAALARRRGIPTEALRISPHQGRVSVGNLDGLQVGAALDTLNSISGTVTTMMSAATAGAAASVIIAVTTAAEGAAAATGAAVAVSNPIGWVIGAAVGAAALIIGFRIGRDALMKWAEGADLAGPVRRLGRESTLLRKIKEQAEQDDVEAKAISGFAEEFVLTEGPQISRALAGAVGEQLRAAAREAALLIERAQ